MMRRAVSFVCLIVGLTACTGDSVPHHGASSTSTSRTTGLSATVSLESPKLSDLPFPVPGAAALPAGESKELTEAIAAAVGPKRDSSLPGITAAVVTPSASWSTAAGRDGTGAPLVTSDEMAIGSISKTFTAAEVLTLAARGKIDLDAPLTRYVHNRLLGLNPTVRQTLGMLSGITDGTGADFYQNPINASIRPDAHVGLTSALAFDKVAALPPGGQQQRYSDAGYSLLALAIEHVTKRSLADDVRADLLQPAGIARAAVQDSQRPSPPIAYPVDPLHEPPLRDGYVPDRAVASATLGCGSVAADAPSVARWGYELYGARLLPAATVEQMATRQTRNGIGNGTGYGIGTVIYPARFGPHLLIGHDGLIARTTILEKQDGYLTLLIVDPTRQFSLALFTPVAGQSQPLYDLATHLVAILDAR